MDTDPDETRNLYSDAAHQKIDNQCRLLLLEWLIRTTRYRTILPNPGNPPQNAWSAAWSAEDGTESNKAGVSRVKRGAVNYI